MEIPRILLVDNHPVSGKLLTEHLRMNHCVVQAARSITVTAKTSQKPSLDIGILLISLDVIMEGAGMLIIKIMRCLFPDIVILIIVNRDTHPDVLHEAEEHGADGIIARHKSSSAYGEVKRAVAKRNALPKASRHGLIHP